MEQTGPPLLVPEQDQILAQRLDANRRITRIVRQSHRMPVTAQQFAHRLAATDLGYISLVG